MLLDGVKQYNGCRELLCLRDTLNIKPFGERTRRSNQKIEKVRNGKVKLPLSQAEQEKVDLLKDQWADKYYRKIVRTKSEEKMDEKDK